MKNYANILLLPVDDSKPAEGIYQQLRQMIVNGEIETGSRLPSERKMMEMVGRSRSTIREALRLLEKDGYITTVSRSSGAIVKEPGVEVVADSLESMIQMQNMDIRHVLEFRRFTETSAASLAAKRRTEEDLADLERILKKAEENLGNSDEFPKCDYEFHVAVAKASKNDMYVIMLNVCRSIVEDRLQILLSEGDEEVKKNRYKIIFDSHHQIHDAIRDGRAEDAFKLMELHLSAAEADIMEGRFL